MERTPTGPQVNQCLSPFAGPERARILVTTSPHPTPAGPQENQCLSPFAFAQENQCLSPLPLVPVPFAVSACPLCR